ncbi:MAG: hypothetical protein L3J35_00210 [Bacteroidales bacterium]|nr:hypothetical protein [Bacteroidales bacterium]
MKTESNSNIKSAASSILFAKIFIAILLIVVGLWAAYIIISVIYMIFTNIQHITFLGKMLSFPKEIKVISMGGDAITMSGSIVGYIIAALLLSMGGRLTFRVIKLGADMVSKLDMKYFYNHLMEFEQKNTGKEDDDKSLLL